MKRQLWITVFAVLLTTLLLSGCIVINPAGSATQEQTPVPVPTDEPAQQTIVPSPKPTATPAVATPVPTAEPTPEEAQGPTPIPDGVTEKKLGYVIKAYTKDGVNYIDIDYADMYTGQEAIQKALEDKSDAVYQDNGKWVIDNDYYIRNKNPQIRTFPVSASCKFEVVDFDSQSSTDGIPYKTVSFAAFSKLVAKSDFHYLLHVTIESGLLSSAQEQFLP